MQHHSIFQQLFLEVKDGVGGHLLVVPRKKFFSFLTVHAVWIIIFFGGKWTNIRKVAFFVEGMGKPTLVQLRQVERSRKFFEWHGKEVETVLKDEIAAFKIQNFSAHG